MRNVIVSCGRNTEIYSDIYIWEIVALNIVGNFLFFVFTKFNYFSLENELPTISWMKEVEKCLHTNQKAFIQAFIFFLKIYISYWFACISNLFTSFCCKFCLHSSHKIPFLSPKNELLAIIWVKGVQNIPVSTDQ